MFRFHKEFPIKRPYVPENFGGLATASGFDNIIDLDFNSFNTFIHVIPVTSCVWVACSNLIRGTFTHLRSDRDPRRYVEELSGCWKSVRPSVVLVGGRETPPEDSMRFVYKLISILQQESFQIVGKDVGGKIDRTTIGMTLTEVSVQRKDKSVANFDFSK